jgi:DNA polymerase elongation subunit (family B)
MLILDLEVYENYFLAAFLNIETREVFNFTDRKHVPSLIKDHTLVTFNGNSFDIPLLSYFLAGATHKQLKVACDAIIGGQRGYQLANESGFAMLETDHIDLIELPRGIASLKTYGGRMHCKTIRDLPYPPDAILTLDQMEQVREYCTNDLFTTLALYERMRPAIALRESMSAEYGQDLRSKSDAQIAEAVIRSRVESFTGKMLPKPKKPKSVRYELPHWIAFDRDDLKALAKIATDSVYRIHETTGAVCMPEPMADLRVKIGQSTYRLGIGGLHSSETCQAVVCDEYHVLIDRDVASYYPNAILIQGCAPETMGASFSAIYRKILDERLHAKRTGDKVKNEALKITLNGSFGKFGSVYSCLYAPNLLIQTTITGQLALLMLIEQCEAVGASVISANTDGIVIHCPKTKRDALQHVIDGWELTTGFETEETQYRAIYSRDVNNYIAIKTDGTAKGKGAYAAEDLSKNPASVICVEAVTQYLIDGKPVEETIDRCDDIRKFISIRSVKGGAEKGGEYLGKVARWYYSTTSPGAILYKTNGNKVPKTEGARPCMTLPDSLPDDMDFEYYVREAHSLLSDIGAIKRGLF